MGPSGPETDSATTVHLFVGEKTKNDEAGGIGTIFDVLGLFSSDMRRGRALTSPSSSSPPSAIVHTKKKTKLNTNLRRDTAAQSELQTNTTPPLYNKYLFRVLFGWVDKVVGVV